MRASVACAFASLRSAVPTSEAAQAATDPAVEALDRAGERAATTGAPGTVVPDAAGAAVAPGIRAPVEPQISKEPVPAAK